MINKKVWVAAYVCEGRRVLVRRRGHGPTGLDEGKYGPPGGHVEAGETLYEALCRETYEETGLRVRSARLLCVYDDLRGGGVVFFYATRLEPGEPGQEEGHGPWEYVDVARLQKLGPDEVQAGLADWLGVRSEYCSRVLTWAGRSGRISVMDEAHARHLQGRGPVYLDGPDTLVREGQDE